MSMYNFKKVEISGINTFELPTLHWEAMKKLFERLRDGEKETRNELVYYNLKLVLSILQRFKNRGENLDDLFQIGCIGLLKAVDNFKLEHNVNFSTYAVPMILGEIKRYLRDNNYLHMSRSLKTTARKIQEIREQFLQEYQKEPTIMELAGELDMSPEEIVLSYNANMEPLSFFEPVFSDSTDPLQLLDLIKDTENTDADWLENIALQEALEVLSPREKYIIIARFFQGKTQIEVADKVGISQAQISRVEKAALRRIREHYNKEEEKRKERKESKPHQKKKEGLKCSG